MYQITSAQVKSGKAQYADKLTFIKVNPESGCYVICDESEAEGVCVKIPVEVTNEENTIVTCEDTVFALKEGGLNGTEPVCVISQAEVAEDYFNAKRSAELLAMIEEVL